MQLTHMPVVRSWNDTGVGFEAPGLVYSRSFGTIHQQICRGIKFLNVEWMRITFKYDNLSISLDTHQLLELGLTSITQGENAIDNTIACHLPFWRRLYLWITVRDPEVGYMTTLEMNEPQVINGDQVATRPIYQFYLDDSGSIGPSSKRWMSSLAYKYLCYNKYDIQCHLLLKYCNAIMFNLYISCRSNWLFEH